MKVLFVSLGCDKNLVDSEHMLGDLIDNGFSICDDEAEADIIVVNTCSFIADAMEESIQTIIDLGAYKENGHLKGLIVTGCLAQRFTDEILEDLPEVDAIIGTNSYDELVAAINKVLEDNSTKPVIKKDLVGLPRDGRRVLTTGGHYAYLKIAEGCNKRCTYCAIPYIRGNYRSVPMEQILAEAKELAKGGVKELILVAQETTVYGIDIYGEPSKQHGPDGVADGHGLLLNVQTDGVVAYGAYHVIGCYVAEGYLAVARHQLEVNQGQPVALVGILLDVDTRHGVGSLAVYQQVQAICVSASGNSQGQQHGCQGGVDVFHAFLFFYKLMCA